ncbi:MAG: hypothetical protein AB8F95_12070 [Bacteroidia bacterium]
MTFSSHTTKSKLIIPLVFACLVLFFSGKKAQEANEIDIIANLIIPVSTPDGLRVLSMDRYPRFHVQLVNISGESVRLWKDWNSWGWFNLTLKLETSEGVTYLRKKQPVWDGDFSDFWQIGPGESVILEVDMSSGHWQGMPDLYGETIPVKLTALYENRSDPLSEAFGIWTGKVSSNTVEAEWR